MTAVTPRFGPESGGTSVTLTGNGFSTASGGTTVMFGSTPAASVTCGSSSSCIAVSPAGFGVVHITATAGDRTSGTGAADQFAYGMTFEETAPQVTLSGSWTSFADPGNSGGSGVYSGQTGATASITFSGSFVDLVFIKQSNAGIANVSVDNLFVEQIDARESGGWTRGARSLRSASVGAGVILSSAIPNRLAIRSAMCCCCSAFGP